MHHEITFLTAWIEMRSALAGPDPCRLMGRKALSYAIYETLGYLTYCISAVNQFALNEHLRPMRRPNKQFAHKGVHALLL